MSEWSVIRVEERCAAVNMSLDEAMLQARADNLIPNTLRLFTWKPAAVSIGYFQSLDLEVDREALKESGCDIVRRYTGGGAVFHDEELTYSVVLSEKDVSSDIVKSYEEICKGVITALRLLGLKAEFKPINDILVGGKKVSGNAQTRKHGVVLQHGTILLGVDVKKMFRLLKVPDEKIRDKLIASVEERVSSVNKELGRVVSVAEMQDALIKGFEESFSKKFVHRSFLDIELTLAKKLFEEKYSSMEWTNAR